MLILKKAWPIFFLALSSLVWANAQKHWDYSITGYTKGITNEKLSGSGPCSKGFHLESEDLGSPEVTVTSGDFNLTIKSDNGIFHDNEGIFIGTISAKLTKKKGDGSQEVFFFYEGKDYEDRLHLLLKDMVLRSKTSKIKYGDHLYEGAAVTIDLVNRKISWPNGPIKDKSAPIRGRFNLKF